MGHALLTNCATGVGLSRNSIDYYDRTPSATSGWPSKCIPHLRPFIFGIPGDGNLKTGTSLSPQFTPLSMVASGLENWEGADKCPPTYFPTSLPLSPSPFPTLNLLCRVTALMLLPATHPWVCGTWRLTMH